MFKEISRNHTHELITNPGVQEFGEGGSSTAVLAFNEEGILPTKNFQHGVFDGAEKIDGSSSLFKKVLAGRDTCAVVLFVVNVL